MIIAVQVIHGICYAFFFATVYIFVDEYFPKDVRTSAQGLFNLMIFGLGDLAAKLIWPLISADLLGKDENYRKVFLIPSGLAILASVILLVGFHPQKQAVPDQVGH